ncbi:MAG: AAA family ATPase [Rhodocyclaceae bacterium]|nr:AAA family ATPase [Rhodocyclaceae bacterium]
MQNRIKKPDEPAWLRAVNESERRNRNRVTYPAQTRVVRKVAAIPYDPPRTVHIECAETMRPKAPEPVIPNFLYRRKVSSLIGARERAKGHTQRAAAARVTRGGTHPSWPDLTPTISGKVLFVVGVEDDPHEIIIPGLKASGADMSKIRFFRGMSIFGQGIQPTYCAADVAAIGEFMARDGGGYALVIFDDANQAVGGDASNGYRAYRGLANLAQMAVSLDVAILVTKHLKKSSSGKDPIDSVSGPQVFGTFPRFTWLSVLNPNYPNDPDKFVLVNVKHNPTTPGGAWGFSIVTGHSADEFGFHGGSVIRWGTRYEGEDTIILKQLECNAPKQTKAPERAAEFLVKTLKGRGEVPVPQILSEGAKEGHSEAALIRAKKILSVEHTKQPGVKHGPWLWYLPL